MITAMCVSPCVDRIYCVNNFETGKMYRVSGTFVSAGGKGVNVARAASLMGEQVKCIGFKAGYAGQWLEKQVMGEGIEALFVEAEGETRTNINIIDREGRTETEILEPGPEIKPGDIDVFMDVFEGCLESTGILVCSGGLARGLPADFYREIIIRVRKKGIKVLLDSSGQSLDRAIRVGPYMVKPNMRELKGFASGDLNTDGDIICAGRKILNEGVEIVIASLGQEGAFLISKEACLKAIVPDIEVVNTIGSGDCSVAGYAVGIKRGYDLENCFRLSMACALANTQFEGIGLVERAMVDDFFHRIKVLNAGG